MASDQHNPAVANRLIQLLAALAFILGLASNSLLFGQPRVNISTSSPPRSSGPMGPGSLQQPGAASAAVSDHRDVLVMLDGGPLHLRLHVALGGVSLAELRRQYVATLMARIDTDKDSKVTRAEAQKSPLLKVK